MRDLEVVNKSFPVRITVTLILTVLVGALISSAFFYIYMDRALGDSYAQRLTNLSEYKYEVLKSSLIIYLLFGMAVLTTIILMSISYSHKVTGPLVRIRIFAKEMKRGNFGIDIRFRTKDIILPIAKSAEDFSKIYGNMYMGLTSLINEMQKDAYELKKAFEQGDKEQIDNLSKQVTERAEELNSQLSKIKT